MAIRVALPGLAIEAPALPVAAARARRVSLASYLQLDPAIRFLIALGLVTAISLLYLVQTSAVTELNYVVQKLQADHTTLLRQHQQLQLDIAQAQSLAHVRNVAVNQLHMVPVGDQYTYLGVPPENAAADGPAVVVPANGTNAAGGAPEGGGGGATP